MNNQYRLSIVVPCFKRPARTRRIINNVLAQTINNWEAFIIGDGCDLFDSLFESGEADFYKQTAEKNQNKFLTEQNKNYQGIYSSQSYELISVKKKVKKLKIKNYFMNLFCLKFLLKFPF